MSQQLGAPADVAGIVAPERDRRGRDLLLQVITCHIVLTRDNGAKSRCSRHECRLRSLRAGGRWRCVAVPQPAGGPEPQSALTHPGFRLSHGHVSAFARDAVAVVGVGIAQLGYLTVLRSLQWQGSCHVGEGTARLRRWREKTCGMTRFTAELDAHPGPRR